MAQLGAALLVCFTILMLWLGNAFVSGQLFPDTFGALYRMFPEMWQRLLLLLLPIFGAGNLSLAYAFSLSATTAAVAAVLAGAIVPVVLAMFIEGLRPGTEVVLAGFAVLCACLWLHAALQRLG